MGNPKPELAEARLAATRGATKVRSPDHSFLPLTTILNQIMSSPHPPHKFQLNRGAVGYALLRDTVPLLSFLGVGALVQEIVIHRSPLSFLGGGLKYALVLPLLLIFGPWVEPLLVSLGLRRNKWLDGVQEGRTFAKLGLSDGGDGKETEMAVLTIGARCVTSDLWLPLRY